MKHPSRAIAALCAAGVLSGCVVVESPPPVPVAGPRRIHIPPGHYPPPGQCRIWYPGRPPGRQPRPVPCASIVVVPGTFVAYQNEAWDVDYDWAAHARGNPGSVSAIVIDVTKRR